MSTPPTHVMVQNLKSGSNFFSDPKNPDHTLILQPGPNKVPTKEFNFFLKQIKKSPGLQVLEQINEASPPPAPPKPPQSPKQDEKKEGDTKKEDDKKEEKKAN